MVRSPTLPKQMQKSIFLLAYMNQLCGNPKCQVAAAVRSVDHAQFHKLRDLFKRGSIHICAGSWLNDVELSISTHGSATLRLGRYAAPVPLVVFPMQAVWPKLSV